MDQHLVAERLAAVVAERRIAVEAHPIARKEMGSLDFQEELSTLNGEMSPAALAQSRRWVLGARVQSAGQDQKRQQEPATETQESSGRS
jgi:hypothetical protein